MTEVFDKISEIYNHFLTHTTQKINIETIYNQYNETISIPPHPTQEYLKEAQLINNMKQSSNPTPNPSFHSSHLNQ